MNMKTQNQTNVKLTKLTNYFTNLLLISTLSVIFYAIMLNF